MKSFLEEVIEKVKAKHSSLENLVFVLPSKRAGSFLRSYLAASARTTFFAPEIYSIESFIEKVSGLAYANGTQQLFKLYRTYLAQNPVPRDNFHTFSKWGQTLLQDFNEIDRYLIDAGKLFDNLSAIQEVEHWSLAAEKTQMMQDYLSFWNNLESLYSDFNQTLLKQGLGHQGLVYRIACEKLDGYLEANPEQNFIFLGFNALNTAESTLVQRILETAPSDIYWDIDSYFLDDPSHDAGLFIRQHLKKWPYLKENGLNGKSSHYLSKKNIKIVGVPKNVSQAKYTSQLLDDLHKKHPERLKNTAVVLGDETLLNPLLNSVPENLDRVNITMGYPLNKTPLASFFDQLMGLYIQPNEQGWFYRDLLVFLAHPSVHLLLIKSGSKRQADSELVPPTSANVPSHSAKGQTGSATVSPDLAGEITAAIKQNNWAYVNAQQIEAIAGQGHPSISLLFQNQLGSPGEFIRTVLKIISQLKTQLQDSKDAMGLEYLYRFNALFNQLDHWVDQHDFIVDLMSLRSLYRQLSSSETLDFRGEPLEGLQIMGMLESRNLDFETVIITSVNEGILPSGKSNNSFIPFDLKVHFGLPTYKEKDAVYTYHFYRLLQRAKHIYILYSTEPDDALGGGERSRLIDQLLTDEKRRDDVFEIHASPVVEPVPKTLESIEKDSGLLELIKAHAANGFSPTSLTNYIRNPMDFYKRNLLGIDDAEEVEENVAANTFGTIVHDTLEDLYRPFVGEYLTKEGLVSAKNHVEGLVKKHFVKSYGEGDFSRGKNLIAFNVIIKYIENFLDLEIEQAQQHQIKIIGLEEKLEVDLDMPELDFPVRLKGKLDRVDEIDGVLRIIDYKTGKVETKNVEIVGWQESGGRVDPSTSTVTKERSNKLITDYDFSKAFQLLCYALMYHSANPVPQMQAGIFSFKNQGAGVMRFATKPSSRSQAKDYSITSDTHNRFFIELKSLILKIFDLAIPFEEKEN